MADTTFTYYVVSYAGRDGEGDVSTVNGIEPTSGDVTLTASDIDTDEQEYFVSAPQGVSLQQTLDESRKADARILSGLTNFMYAYRVPATESFDAQDILDAALAEKKVYDGTNGGTTWSYITDKTPAATALNDIPLWDTSDYSVLNGNGAYTSCATAITNILYRLGLTDISNPSSSDTDIKDKARVSEARRKDISLPFYLQQRGWKIILSAADLVAGDIVFCRACSSPDERRYNPAHTFIYVTSTTSYDFGNTTNIRSGGVDTIDWTTGGSLASFGWNPTIFGFCADPHNPTSSGNALWTGRTSQRIDSSGNPSLVTELYCSDSLREAEVVTTVVEGSLVSTTNVFPIVKEGLLHNGAIHTQVKLFKDGHIQVKLYGTSDGLSAGTTYTLFSFNTFDGANRKVMQGVYEQYVRVTPSAIAQIITEPPASQGDVTLIKMIPWSDIPNGTAIRAVWHMELN